MEKDGNREEDSQTEVRQMRSIDAKLPNLEKW
jgi:hypothetical protein